MRIAMCTNLFVDGIKKGLSNFKREVLGAGLKWDETPKKGTDYIVINKRTSKKSDIKLAKQMGISVIDWKEFELLVEDTMWENRRNALDIQSELVLSYLNKGGY